MDWQYPEKVEGMDILGKIREDIHHLAGTSFTRRYGTEGELRASEYIRSRLMDMGYTPHVDPFHCPRSSYAIFALYWFEYLFVVLFSFFSPLLGFMYGLSVLIFYGLELFGFFALSRFIDEFQSQNIYAELNNDSEWYVEPRVRIVFHANYDSGVTHVFHTPWVLRYLPNPHDLALFGIGLILGICLWDAVYDIAPLHTMVSISVRLAGLSILICLCIMSVIGMMNEEDTRGANYNASGVACLLNLAEYFRAHRPDDVQLGFLFTGAEACWMAGLRHFLSQNRFHGDRTLFVHVECVGSGELHLSLGERCIVPLSITRRWRLWLTRFLESEGLHATRNLVPPTASFIILSRGYPAVTLVGLGKDGLPQHKNQLLDTVLQVDEPQVQRAIDVIIHLVQYITSQI